MAEIRASEASLDVLCEDLATLQPIDLTAPAIRDPGCETCWGLNDWLELKDVSYSYPEAVGQALSRLSLRVPGRTTIGLVGRTGCGKTTTVDVLVGLLRPSAGSILVDGKELGDNDVRPWQRSLGYVPQQIFLVDDTVEANIAFGVPPEKIDRAAVTCAARAARLHNFVTEELPEGYHTLVGERGVRLSGGQRQRIGIARALYHDPDILVFDEATSAVDNVTERAVMEALGNLRERKTIVIIAHRLSTVRQCDIIFMLERGRVVGRGRFEELLASHAGFRALADAT